MNKKRIVIICVIVFLTSALVFTVLNIDNYNIGVTEYTIKSNNLPASFDGFKIVQLSDLHNEDFGDGNQGLLNLIISQKPDIIIVTGDSIDSRRTDTEITLDFFKKLKDVAPVYLVIGNHELRVSTEEFYKLLDTSENMGINVLRNESVFIEKESDKIQIIGVDDVTYFSDTPDEYKIILKENIEKTDDINTFSILLSHHPEVFDVYASTEVDLVFSGHAHGGQIRLPFGIGGVIAPEQYLFPKYDEGVFEKDGTTMIISRGLGNSILPLRINNPPELVVATIETE